MSRQSSALEALASSVWKLVSAWWNVDRIRVPHSRRADSPDQTLDDQNHEVESARTRRVSPEVKDRSNNRCPISFRFWVRRNSGRGMRAKE
jgi:hypothetical protein